MNEEKTGNEEKIFKSKTYQILIPLDTTIENVVDKEKFTVKDFNRDLILIERREIEESGKKD
jgi:hypothetical protein